MNTLFVFLALIACFLFYGVFYMKGNFILGMCGIWLCVSVRSVPD